MRRPLGDAPGLASAVVSASAPSPGQVAESTRQMAALLKERAAAVDPMKLPYLVNDRRADVLAQSLDDPLPLAKQLTLRSATRRS